VCVSISLFYESVANFYVLCVFRFHIFIISFRNANFAVSTFHALHYTTDVDYVSSSSSSSSSLLLSLVQALHVPDVFRLLTWCAEMSVGIFRTHITSTKQFCTNLRHSVTNLTKRSGITAFVSVLHLYCRCFSVATCVFLFVCFPFSILYNYTVFVFLFWFYNCCAVEPTRK
jgi:hypothetical protein